MTVEKQDRIGTVKAKVAGGKANDVLPTTGGVTIVGMGGDAKPVSAKAIGIEDDPQARGIVLGHTVKFDPKTGHYVLGQKIEETHPISAAIVVGEDAMIGLKARGDHG